MKEEIIYSIALRASPLVGDINFMKLVEAAGSAKEAWELSKKLLKDIPGIGTKISKGIGDEKFLKFAEKELNFCEKNGIEIKLRHRNQFPQLLSECDDAPAILYQKGRWDENLRSVSIVGTRNLTAYGKKFIEEFIHCLKDSKVVITSGLALGTDGYAHQEALKNNIATVGVLAHGLHTIYPATHHKLSKEIIEQGGALLSEFNSSEKPDREHFLQRNRIIAGLSTHTVVVETALGGGSISTVSHANNYNREVFALPGKFHDKCSQGCNRLIAQNKARIIDSVTELVDEILQTKTEKVGQLFSPREIQLDEKLQPIYNCIAENSPISLDDLSLQLKTPSFKILPMLLDLELMGYIKALSGRQYEVI